MAEIERVTQRYRNRIKINPETGCWVWTGAKTSKGRGCVHLDGHTITVHRLFFELFIGPVPDGFELHHKCKVIDCCNPDHIQIVTRIQHRRLRVGGRYANAEKTHCKNGHPFTSDNTYRHDGQRHCKACRSAAVMRVHRRRKEAFYG